MSKVNLNKTSCKFCGSSDAVQMYQQSNGSVDGHCFSCGKKHYFDTKEFHMTKKTSFSNSLSKEEVSSFPYRTTSDRRISDKINERYGVRVSVNEITGEVDTVYYPYHIKGVLSGYKIRKLPKDFDSPPAGSIKNADPFGWHLLDLDNNKRIVITEGEEDTLALSDCLWQATGRKKFANIISLKDGASSIAKLKPYLDVLNSAEMVIAAFDSDVTGRSALTELSLLIEPGKFFIMELPEKDASECWVKNKDRELKQAYLNAKPFRPGGIITIAECRQVLENKPTRECIMFPEFMKKTNKLTYGMHFGELNIFTACPSGGKTQLFREVIYNLFDKTNYNVGVISLEESLEDTTNGLRSLYLNKRIHLPDVYNTLTNEERQSSWDFITKDNRLVFYDQFASLEDSNVISSIKHMATLQNCKFIFLDHIGIILYDTPGGGKDERSRIDKLLITLRSLAQNLQICINLVVHLSRPDKKKDFSKGYVPSYTDLRGSGAFEQLANTIIALQRNLTHSDESMRNIIGVHLLKCRFNGASGECDYLRYDTTTGRLGWIPKPIHGLLEQEKSGYDEVEI